MTQKQVTKNSGWSDIINANFTEIFGGGSYSDTGWTSAGISFLNGASKGNGDAQYRTLTRGSLGITFLSISVQAPAEKSAAYADFVQLPDAAQAQNRQKDFGNFIRTDSNAMALWGFDGEKIFVQSVDAWTAADTMTIAGFFLFTVK